MANENHVLSNLLQVFSIMLLVTLEIVESNDAGYYEKLSKTHCLKNRLIRIPYAPSLIDCASSCMMTNKCGVFSYCKGTCKLHESLVPGSPIKTTCNCITYLMLDRNSRNRVKIYDITKYLFKESILYRFWNNWPIDKVKLVLIKNNTEIHSLTFNAKMSSNTDWFHSSRLLSTPWFGNVAAAYSKRYFKIQPSGGNYLLHVLWENYRTYEIRYRMNIDDTEEQIADRVDIYAYS
ncbi:uncharacterized protein LOC106876625 isoform X2 [Octopus bimaculoides]|uniref:uncharacterized protein LOC106876625 isoform X2 n=1 Tax=Octopus bimaculoides TaxID=37653 RepID=UPI00071C251D|nr:uncharacterized protein LOC106876625 isoform X2 [Octopus bimaculoides]|eukprot:XP_014780727.1 PREDICTED: uncharacterized protein LOC106876625 isoform X2 [Octopus bimaculoides]